MTGRSSGSAGARGPRSTWWASITPRSAAARSWPLPDMSRRRAFSRSNWRARAEAVRPFRHRGRYKLHLGTAEVSAVLSLLETNESSPGQPQLAQLFVAEPVVAVHGQPFVLRAQSPPATLGGGRVLQPSPRRLRRRDHVSLARLGRLRSVDPVDRLCAALAFLGLALLDRAPAQRADGPGRRRDRIGAGGTDGVGGPGRASGRAEADGPRPGRVCRRSRGQGLARLGPAARGSSPAFGDPARPARGEPSPTWRTKPWRPA